MAKKVGRPTGYSKSIAEKLCEAISTSHKGLPFHCKKLKITVSAVYRWLIDYPEFKEQYVRAREAQADYMADMINEVAEDGVRKTIKGVAATRANAFISAKRLQIDSLKWCASKLKPKKYGDKLDVTTDGEKIQGQIAWLGNHGNAATESETK